MSLYEQHYRWKPRQKSWREKRIRLVLKVWSCSKLYSWKTVCVCREDAWEHKVPESPNGIEPKTFCTTPGYPSPQALLGPGEESKDEAKSACGGSYTTGGCSTTELLGDLKSGELYHNQYFLNKTFALVWLIPSRCLPRSLNGFNSDRLLRALNE